jgi:hypothetical protein
MPDTIFLNSPRTEEKRLEMTRKIIASGFYEKHGFLVLNRVEEDQNIVVVYPQDYRYVPINTYKKEREWRTVEEEFWVELERFFPSVCDFCDKVEVRISKYGTVSSSATLGSPKSRKRVYYLREDADISHLAAIIINQILYLQRKNLGITWSKREALMDFIMTRPKMRKLFPKFRPMMSQLARVSARLRKKSDQYLEGLGIRPIRQDLEILGVKVVVKGVVINGELSKLEKKALHHLIEKTGELVTYDELADLVWGIGEFKTYWALNKIIERMRDKLKKMGIEPTRIESVRGQGYLLK